MDLKNDLPEPISDLDNYFPTSKLLSSKGELFYHVIPQKRNGEDKTKVKLYWGDEGNKWFANIEGNYFNQGSRGFFVKGPYELNVKASEKLCDYFKGDWPWIKDGFFVKIVSRTSLEQFEEISKLEKASKLEKIS